MKPLLSLGPISVDLTNRKNTPHLKSLSSISEDTTITNASSSSRSCIKENNNNSECGGRSGRTSFLKFRSNYNRNSNTSTVTTATTSTSGSTFDTTNSGGSRGSSTVSFGTLHVREYERKLDETSDCDLGLAIGWEYTELDPIELQKIFDTEPEDKPYCEAELTTEVERAKILLANGYSKQHLRWALESKYHVDNSNSDGSKNNSDSDNNNNNNKFAFKRFFKRTSANITTTPQPPPATTEMAKRTSLSQKGGTRTSFMTNTGKLFSSLFVSDSDRYSHEESTASCPTISATIKQQR